MDAERKIFTMITIIKAHTFYPFERKALYLDKGSFSCGNNGRLRMGR